MSGCPQNQIERRSDCLKLPYLRDINSGEKRYPYSISKPVTERKQKSFY